MSRPHKWVELETPIVDLYTLKPKEFAFRNTAKLKTTQDKSTDAGKWALKRFKSSRLISRGSLLQKWLLESLLLRLIETFEFQELILLRLTFFLNVVCFFSFKCFSNVVYYATRAFINICRSRGFWNRVRWILLQSILGEMAKISKIFTFIKVGSVLGTPKTLEGGSKCRSSKYTIERTCQVFLCGSG